MMNVVRLVRFPGDGVVIDALLELRGMQNAGDDGVESRRSVKLAYSCRLGPVLRNLAQKQPIVSNSMFDGSKRCTRDASCSLRP